MGDEIKWDALPVIVELLGIDDVARLMTHLVSIRDHWGRVRAAASQ